MKLSRIKLVGFKSFVDPTVLPLKDALNGIVGPNGCGKSNIIDAVRWVLGESSASKLRGESLSDVIFNGSTARKPVGQATVELIFDNAEGTLKGEYAQYCEISVKRQVTRDGQSHYYLNNTRCRRRDITGVFAGTGLGPRSYSIIEQGMIARIIECKPLELRVFFEEAAGISIYKARRKDTETRMRQTRENLERVTDIIQEQENRLERLKRQSEMAAKYKLYQVEEKNCTQQLNALRLKTLTTEQDLKTQTARDLDLKLESMQAEKTSIDTKLEQHHGLQIEKNDSYQETQAAFYDVGTKIAKKEQALEYHREQKARLESDLAQAALAYTQNETQLTEETTTYQALEEALKQIQPDYVSASEKATKANGFYSEQQLKLQTTQEDFEQLQDIAQENQSQAEVAKSTIEQLEKQAKQAHSRLEYLVQEQTAFRVSAIEEKCQKLISLLETQQQEESEFSEQIEKIETQIGIKQEENKNHIESLHLHRENYQTLKGKQSALEMLQKAALGKTDNGVQSWLSENALQDTPIVGEHITVEPEWTRALETVLGRYLTARCLDSFDLFENMNTSECFSSLTQGEMILVENKSIATDRFESHAINTLNTLHSKIKTDFNINSFLSGVFVAENVQEALKKRSQLQSHESIITKEGIWIGPNWIRIYRDKDANAGVLAREAELKTIGLELEKESEQINLLNTDIQSFQTELGKLDQERQTWILKQKEQTKILTDTSSQLSATKARLEHVQDRITRMNAETKALKISQEEIGGETETLREALAISLEKMAEYVDKLDILKTERDELKDTVKLALNNAQSLKEAEHALAMQKQMNETRIHALESSTKRLREQLDFSKQREADLKKSLEALTAPAESLSIELNDLLETRASMDSQLTIAKDALEAVTNEIRTFEKARLALEEQMQFTREKLQNVKLDIQAFRVRRESILEQHPDIEEVLDKLIASLPEDATVDTWQEKLDKIEQKIQRLGAINLAAIEEYDAELERKEYLASQHADLSEALETLEAAIRKIDKETRTKFKETFEVVNHHFQTLFPKLFGGGRAILELVGDDLLEAGVSVMAQPPGKKNTSIYLLSGGGKSIDSDCVGVFYFPTQSIAVLYFR